MSDASSEFDPVTTTSDAYHTRLSSNASTSSSASSASSDSIDVNYPTFDLYPLQIIDNEAVAPKNIGLLQPGNSFTHHGTHCAQIPKLRIACAAGPNGRRTMWSFCEDCGSISMVDSD
ncbi:hypothetical protein PILCRDRAFT_57034 [Piloderma croceum F 1598]|uniref:Uncharacterized protein n=1 Tax=Piloderma croceum (strain F 1598) TaxID=765440 RepID=A0A0C3CQS1_PILCF|nr:hypothetical protein PILCRDRAFT_57034 [Piloderma croceum F 1598]